MNIYIYILWVILLNIFQNNINRKLMLKLLIIPLFISLGTQIAIGTDYYSYINIFNFGSIYVESSFLLFISFLKKITNNPRILFISIAFIQSFLFYILIKKFLIEKYIENLALFVLSFIIGTHEFILMFNALRSSIAAMCFNLFLYYYTKNKKLKGIGYILFGACFHKSILIGVLLFVIIKFILKYKKYYDYKFFWISYILTCYFFYKFEIIRIISKFIYNLNIDFEYKTYLISNHMYAYTEGLGIANNIQLILAIIIIYFSYSKNNNFFKYNGYIFLGLKLLFTNIPILGRITEYGQISIALVTYYALLNLKKTKIEIKYIIYLGIIFYYILLTYWKAYIMINNATNNF